MNEDHEVDIDQPFQRPLLLARKVALPKRIGVASDELVLCVLVVARRRSEARRHDHVFHRLARNVNAHPPKRAFSDTREIQVRVR